MAVLRGMVADWLRLASSARARPFLATGLLIDGAFIFVFFVAIQTYLPEQHGGAASLPGYALAVYGAAKLLGQVLGGRSIDRFGARRALRAGIGLIVFAQALLLLGARWPEAALPAAAGYGLGSALVWPALYSLATTVFAQDERAKLTSALTLTTGIGLAGGLGLGLVLPERFPYEAASLVAGGAVALAYLFARSIQAEGAKSPGGESATPALREALQALARPERLGLSAIVLLQSASIGALLAVFRSYGRDVLDVSLREEAVLLAPAAACCAVAVVAGGVLADRIGRAPLLVTGFFAVGAAVWGLSALTDRAVVVPLGAAAGLGIGLALPAVGAMSMDLARGASKGAVLAWFMAFEGLGHAAGPAFGAWLSAESDPTAVLRIVGMLFCGAALAAFAVRAFAEIGAEQGEVSASVLLEETTP